MPLSSSYLGLQAKAKAASVSVAGEKLPGIVDSISMATATYVLGTAQVQATNVVLGPGAGTFTGTIAGLNPTAMSTLMMTKAATAGFSGRDLKKLMDAVAFGVVQAVLQVVVQGSVIGGGPGTGTGKVLALVPTALQAQILAALSGRNLVGSKTNDLVGAMAFGICNHIMSAGTITTTCVGAFAGPPTGPVTIPAAPGIGKLA
jgi:hypothetical protein